MKNQGRFGQRTRIAGLVLIVPMLVATGLRAGEIHDAAAAGDLNKVKSLLAGDPALLESKGNLGFRPLHSACYSGQAAVANLLLDRGADVKARDSFQQTALHRACYVVGQDPVLVRRLIEQGADINAQGYNSLTPLHFAALHGEIETARLLLDHGADPNAFDTYTGSIGSASVSGTALQVAINYHPKEAMAQLLVERGAKLGRQDSAGNTELHLAALKGYADLARTLVQHGADVHAVNQFQRTALYYAAKHGYRRTAEALIAAGARENALIETNYGKAPQLAATLADGEAWLWTLGGGGYAVKTKGHLLVFNPDAIDDAAEAGLANGRLNANELTDQKITGLITLPERWWDSYPLTFDLAKRIPAVSSVVYPQPMAGGAATRNIPSYRAAAPNESLSADGIRVHAFPALGGGMGYLVEADGVKILHAGLHVSGNEEPLLVRYRKEIDFLKPFGPVDIAIVSVSAHANEIKNAYEPHLYLLDQLSPKAIYLFGANVPEQYLKCAEVLRARNLPVTFPEQERARGERFHFLREQTSAALPAKNDSAAPMGAYFGQKSPGARSEIFAPGIISLTDRQEDRITFSPDGKECFFTVWGPNYSSAKIYWTKGVDEVWTPQVEAPFSANNFASNPSFSVDGNRVYFHRANYRGPEPYDLWMVERTPRGWSEPRHLPSPINSDSKDGGYTETADGVAYFCSNRPGGLDDKGDLWRTRKISGQPLQVENLGATVNSSAWDSAPVIAPDGSYLIFTSERAGKVGSSELYVTFADDQGGWTAPANLNDYCPGINGAGPHCANGGLSLSADGRYLFFTRLTAPATGVQQDIYWVQNPFLDPARRKPPPPKGPEVGRQPRGLKAEPFVAQRNL